MRVALMIEGQEGVTWDDWVALARACERSGVKALLRSDDYSGFHGDAGGSLDAWATINALAAATETVRLGTMVSPATFRHLSVLARMAATADHVSGGRITLGIGAGWYELEHEQFGFEFRSAAWRVELFGEQIEIVHRQLNEDAPFDFEGKHYRLRNCNARPKPVQRPIPILVGGAARPGTGRPAARFASEYNTTFPTPDEARERRARLDEFCAEIGRDPSSLPLSMMTQCVIGRDRAEVDERLSELRRPPWKPEGALIGTVDEVAERLREYESAGISGVMCQHLLHRDVEMVELLGTELAPAVA